MTTTNDTPAFDAEKEIIAIRLAEESMNHLKAEVKRLKQEMKSVFTARDKAAKAIIDRLNVAEFYDEDGNELSFDEVCINGNKMHFTSAPSECCMGVNPGTEIVIDLSVVSMTNAELVALREKYDVKPESVSNLITIETEELEYGSVSSWYESHDLMNGED